VQNQISPVVLTFSASDPVSAIGIQADLASFAAMGCHGVSVLTALLVGDTTEVDDIHPIDADTVDNQARTLLEDMQISAFKIGQIGSVENVSAIAEIISDYPDLPVVLDPLNAAIETNDEDGEDMLIAITELLIPQATVLLISANDLSRLAETWREPTSLTGTEAQLEMVEDVMELINSGCEYVFVTDVPNDDHEITNALFNETGLIRSDRWQRVEGVHVGANNTMSAAIAALLANGLDMPEAVMEAQEFTVAAIHHAQRLGMGKLIPDRYFWAREPDSGTLADDTAAIPTTAANDTIN
jgi:hydroxymethylpyrimidine/phosphomethylpyrimidine kinase